MGTRPEWFYQELDQTYDPVSAETPIATSKCVTFLAAQPHLRNAQISILFASKQGVAVLLLSE